MQNILGCLVPHAKYPRISGMPCKISMEVSANTKMMFIFLQLYLISIQSKHFQRWHHMWNHSRHQAEKWVLTLLGNDVAPCRCSLHLSQHWLWWYHPHFRYHIPHCQQHLPCQQCLPCHWFRHWWYFLCWRCEWVFQFMTVRYTLLYQKVSTPSCKCCTCRRMQRCYNYYGTNTCLIHSIINFLLVPT